jgi:transcriptional regulator with GAF, ATPase, and Fis domain
MIELEVIEGASPGATFDLSQDVSMLGRSPECEVTLADEHVSARHARVVQGLEGSASVEDLGSTNGTYLTRGGQRSTVDEALPLEDGDIIELGSDGQVCRLRVSVVDDDSAAHVVSVRPIEDATPPDDMVTLRALFDAQAKIGRARDLDAVLHAISFVVFDLVPYATHVTVVLQAVEGRKKQGNYLPVLTRVRPEDQGGPQSGDARDFVPITRSVYRKVLNERAAVLAADAPKEVANTPSLMGASVRSCIAVPLWAGEEILGVLQVDNRDAPGMLKGGDLDVLLCIAEQASLAVANGRLIKHLEVAEQRARQQNIFLKDQEQKRRSGGRSGPRGVDIIGDSDAMKALLSQIDKVADTNVNVLVEGETGSGKELVASALHYRSRRRDELFVAQNCAALAETLLESELFGHVKGAFTGATEDKKGLFELADRSTLFLDEITEAPMSIQSKLLRALQEGEIRPVGASLPRNVSVRIVAATNRNLEEEVKAGRFREDLYYRLKVFPLRVPSLRERRTDIPLLIQHFLERYSVEIGKPVAGITAQATNLLVAYDWPGNVRELQNEIQRAVIQIDAGGFVTAELLSPRMRKGEDIVAKAGAARGTLKETMTAVEKYIIYEALRAHGNNKTNTAKSLGITREGLHKKLRQYEK